MSLSSQPSWLPPLRGAVGPGARPTTTGVLPEGQVERAGSRVTPARGDIPVGPPTGIMRGAVDLAAMPSWSRPVATGPQRLCRLIQNWALVEMAGGGVAPVHDASPGAGRTTSGCELVHCLKLPFVPAYSRTTELIPNRMRPAARSAIRSNTK
jgi:hypothetical protein